MQEQSFPFDLSGKSVLVTGASRGAGFGIARAFAGAGAEVIATGRNLSGLQRLRDEVTGVAGTILPLAGDLSTRAATREIARQAGNIDILVNNAALTTSPRQSLVDCNDDTWDREFAVNVVAPVTLMQALVPGMIARGGGVVINISSIAVKRPHPLNAAYAASKAALETASKAAAVDFAPHGVRVNVVQLGLTDTDALHELLPPGLTAAQLGQMLVPRGRVTLVSEVAALCLFLASEGAAAISGAVITVDGGGTAGTFEPRPGIIPG
jgi:NAD(P)-dependent dehydrogenase (short-subunit alcohol dehydrogenase family)